MSNRKGNFRRLLVIGALVVVVAAVVLSQVDLGALGGRGVAFFREAGPGYFFVAMAVLPLFGMPLSPFTIVAGPVFGPTLGVGNVIACAVLAVAVNVSLSYWIAARALRPGVIRLAHWLGYSLPALPNGTACEITLLVRIIPGPPFFIQSYALALAQVPFRIYLIVSTLVPALYLSSAILAGDALVRHDWRGLIFAGVLFVLAAVAIHRLRKRFGAKGREVRAEGRA